MLFRIWKPYLKIQFLFFYSVPAMSIQIVLIPIEKYKKKKNYDELFKVYTYIYLIVLPFYRALYDYININSAHEQNRGLRVEQDLRQEK